MDAQPQKQHQWLDKFIGEWTWESEYGNRASTHKNHRH
jgi:hypothetical protein